MLYNTAREETAIQSQQYKILGRNFVQHKHCYTLHQRIRRWLLLQVVVHLLVVWCWPYSTSNTDSKYSMVARAPSLNELTNSSQPAEAREKHTGEAKKADTQENLSVRWDSSHLLHYSHPALWSNMNSGLFPNLYAIYRVLTSRELSWQHLSDCNITTPVRLKLVMTSPVRL